jgi:hypothetical protein
MPRRSWMIGPKGFYWRRAREQTGPLTARGDLTSHAPLVAGCLRCFGNWVRSAVV